MKTYVLSDEAARDIDHIWDYIAEQSVESADQVVREIREAMELLANAPGIGHRRADVKDKRYRFWRVNRFIVAYARNMDQVRIIRVVGGHQDFRRIAFRP